MTIDWTASKVASGLNDKDRRRELATLLLSLDEPMPYSNADHEIKSRIFQLIKEAAIDGKTHLINMYGDIVS